MRKRDIKFVKLHGIKALKAKRAAEMRRHRSNLRKDPVKRVIQNVRDRLRFKISGLNQIKDKTFYESFGCTYDFFRIYILNQFNNGMTWDNHGEVWELDHIKPISLAKTKEEVYELSHYTNLQPLLKADNRSKSNKW